MTAWRLLKSGEHKELLSRIYKFTVASSRKKSPIEYSNWREQWVELNKESRKELVEQIEVLSSRPSFTLILDTAGWDTASLFSTIDSVTEQLYPDWVLHITNGNMSDSDLPEKIRILNDSRIKISEISASDPTDWVVELSPDTQLHEAALFSAAVAINENPEIAILYSDHDHVDPHGNFCDPYMKPDWNPDLFAAMNYLTPFIAFKRELWANHGDRPSDQYLFLVEIAKTLSRNKIFHIPHVLATVRINGDGGHLQPACKRVIHDLPDPAPTVSILIPTHDQGYILERCLKSIFEKTDYLSFEIILIDHETTEVKALNVISEFKGRKNFKVVNYSGSFNFSAIMNRAAKVAEGQILISLNNDTEIIDSEWLTELASQVSRPEVGVVGALLLFGDDTIQHAGVHPGEGGLMGHGHKHLPGETSGYFNRLKAVHEVAAVTGACMAVEKSTWFELGGLDQENLAVAYNDVDLCFKARKKGLRVILTPYARVMHHESVSRGEDDNPILNDRLRKELETMKARWGKFIESDPAYSPNLSFDGGSFTLARKPRTRYL